MTQHYVPPTVRAGTMHTTLCHLLLSHIVLSFPTHQPSLLTEYPTFLYSTLPDLLHTNRTLDWLKRICTYNQSISPTLFSLPPSPIYTQNLHITSHLHSLRLHPSRYRSGQPNEVNFPFLEKLKLRAVVYISPEDPSEQLRVLYFLFVFLLSTSFAFHCVEIKQLVRPNSGAYAQTVFFPTWCVVA